MNNILVTGGAGFIGSNLCEKLLKKNFVICVDNFNDYYDPQVKRNNIQKPDVIIIDPPRSGMHKNTVNDVIPLSPEKIVYVSCNPATQARDIKMMVEAGYKLKKMKSVDMFPHTYHIENVAVLIR